MPVEPSLAGIIDSVETLYYKFAQSRYVDRVWRRYQGLRQSDDFSSRYCHGDMKINKMGIYDNVSALSVNFSWFAQILPDNYSFHNHRISDCVLVGYHALAWDEARAISASERWEADETSALYEMEQMWFSGSHVAIGGIFWRHEIARPLSNIPVIWMMEYAERLGLRLPEALRNGLHINATAQTVGMSRGLGRLIWLLSKRQVKLSSFKWIHPSVSDRN